jgi:hypothetical protein
VIAVIAELGIEADMQHVQSVSEIAEHGVLPTPVLTVNGVIKTKGRLLARSEIKRLVRAALG